MRDGIFILDADGHVMDRPHRCYQKYLPEKTIPYVLGWVGEDNILYASDYPHWDSEWPHTVDELLKRDDLSQGVKMKILGQNALAFYGVKTPQAAGATTPAAAR